VGGWIWLDGGRGASSPNHERRWLILLAGIVRAVFELWTWWAPNVGTQKPKGIKF
jgi:hypothetical protein